MLVVGIPHPCRVEKIVLLKGAPTFSTLPGVGIFA
jgi:hypothetical protein